MGIFDAFGSIVESASGVLDQVQSVSSQVGDIFEDIQGLGIGSGPSGPVISVGGGFGGTVGGVPPILPAEVQEGIQTTAVADEVVGVEDAGFGDFVEDNAGKVVVGVIVIVLGAFAVRALA